MSMRQLKITKSITNRESQSLEKYLQEIGKVELISPEEEVALAIRIKNGDQIALDKLTKANLRFVVSVAKQYQNQGLTLPDLINEGNLGLIKAAQRFDETRGFKFISYAVWWIAEELVVFLDIEIEEVTATLGSGIRHVSMDQPLSDGEDSTLMDVMINPNAISTDNELAFKASLKTEIERSLSTLSERQKDVIRYFFGIGIDHALSLEDIGERFNLTRERVRQIKDKAITKLRTASRCKLLKTYLGG